MRNKILFFLSIVSFLISLVLPVHFIFDKPDEYLGYVYLSVGWYTFPYLDFFCWLGNFTLLVSWIFYKKKFSLYTAYLTAVLMSFYGINHLFELDILMIKEYHLPLFGYWLWFLSSIFQIIYLYKRNYIKSQTI
ncbi:hypothetical protein SAMN05421738_10659 [Algoriella xinjiangensis]|uniref:Uncharacterized protein n=1 Tax=Algoriella xinjiangensis TaxID=684065 RepID=A0A1I4VZJ5_9FLAO|nr:hypothetical protein SAMN05421738_10659 [Algoriella xinjiangensis]